jgi:hypothetical protein
MLEQEQNENAILAGGPRLRLAEYGTADPEYNDLAPGGSIDWEVNAVQTVTITGTPTGGTFTLTVTDPDTGETETTAGIAYNAAASAVKSALEALTFIGVGDVACSGGAFPGTPVAITFQGDLAGRTIALITASAASLTGGTSPAVTVANTTEGYGYTEPFKLTEDTEVIFVEKTDEFVPAYALGRTSEVVVQKHVDMIKGNMSQRSAAALELALGAMTRTVTAAGSSQVGLARLDEADNGDTTYYKAILEYVSANGGFFLEVFPKVRFSGDFSVKRGHKKDMIPVNLKAFVDEASNDKSYYILEQTADATA